MPRDLRVLVTIEVVIRRKYEALAPLNGQRTRRCWAGIEADTLGEGGIAAVSIPNRLQILNGSEFGIQLSPAPPRG